MQIGEFARVCNTKISVLRHYDREGLLVPDYIDRFTGYRYYTGEQVDTFLKISALKKAGFSLTEIKALLAQEMGREELLQLFEQKACVLQQTLASLKQARKILLGDERKMKVTFIEEGTIILAKSEKVGGDAFGAACDAVEDVLVARNYQRITPYMAYGEPSSGEVQAVCEVVRLQEEEIRLPESPELPFADDPAVVGKWRIIGEFAVKEDFYAQRRIEYPEAQWRQEYLYFLPGGEQYWCYGWTKGKLTVDSGDGRTVNDYVTEMYDGARYMFVDLKSYNYRHGGRTTVLVLRQMDNTAYSAREIARKDSIDKPFVPDERVLGKWTAFGFYATKEAFDPRQQPQGPWYFSDIEFKPGGEVISHYAYGRERIGDRKQQEWTKGYVLRKWNATACAYEIRVVDGVEYLMLEWKSGDYRWGGFDTDYYVFVRG